MTVSHIASRRLAAAIFVLLIGQLAASPARAEVDQNVGGWIVATGQRSFGDMNEKLRPFHWWMETQIRFRDDLDGFGQFLIRPGLGWMFSEHGGLWAGYDYLLTSPATGDNSQIQQAWQQFTWSEPSGSFKRLWRTRLEQRFSQAGDDVGVRLRQLFRTSIAVREGSRFSVILWDEVFFHLRDTDWNINAGFGENRFFAGIGWRVDQKAHVQFELGYMNQYVDIYRATNQVNHTISFTTHFR